MINALICQIGPPDLALLFETKEHSPRSIKMAQQIRVRLLQFHSVVLRM